MPTSNTTITVARLEDLLEQLPSRKPDETRSLHNATIKTNDGLRDVVLKKLPRQLVISECVGWLVARLLGLRTLDAWLVPLEDQFAFATTKSDIQTIEEAGIKHQDDYWDQGVTCDWFRQALVFDTLVGNYDRVLKNMFFLGKAPEGDFVFMDHDKILTQDNWQPEILHYIKNQSIHNNLVRFLPHADKGTKNTILKTAQTWQKLLRGEKFEFLDQLYDLTIANEEDITAVKTFLKHRAGHLTPLVFAHLNQSKTQT